MKETGAKSDDFAAKRIAADCARPSDTLAAENYFSDVHAATHHVIPRQ